MHELMVAQNLLTAISAESEKLNARPISARISCGSLYAINDEALCFAFGAIAKGTTCEGVILSIEHKPTQGQCKDCGQSFEVELSDPKCTNCGSRDFELLAEAPLILEQIELETASNGTSYN